MALTAVSGVLIAVYVIAGLVMVLLVAIVAFRMCSFSSEGENDKSTHVEINQQKAIHYRGTNVVENATAAPNPLDQSQLHEAAPALEAPQSISIDGGIVMPIVTAVYPPPGAYESPLAVTFDGVTSFAEAEFYVEIHSPQGHSDVVRSGNTVTLLGYGECRVRLVPLASTQTFDGGQRVEELVYHLRPQPPKVIPGVGDILDSTAIRLVAPVEHTAECEVKYSLDGTPPSILYTKPFFPPPLGPMNNAPLNILAATIAPHGIASAIVAASLTVVTSDVALFDPALPMPECVVTTRGAVLSFAMPPSGEAPGVGTSSHHNESGSGRSLNVIYYTMAMASGALKPPALFADDKAVPVTTEVTAVAAWAVNTFSGRCSAVAWYGSGVYAPSAATHNYTFRSESGDDIDFSLPPAVVAATQRRDELAKLITKYKSSDSKKKRKRKENSAKLLKAEEESAQLQPPQIHVACHSASLEFDIPPVVVSNGYELRYTLDAAEEPGLSSAQFHPDRAVDITAALVKNPSLSIRAKYFDRNSNSKYHHNRNRDYESSGGGTAFYGPTLTRSFFLTRP